MAGTDWTPIVVPVATASISFVAAVVAVVVGQYLGRKSQRAADEARWRREDTVRRRTRSEEMARQAIERLSLATQLVGWTAGYERGAAKGGDRHYVPANLDEVVALCSPVRRCALEIDDPGVSQHLEKACDLLPNANPARDFGGPHPAKTAWAVQQTSEALISSYLRGVPLPEPVPDAQATAFRLFERAYSAMRDLWGTYDDGDDDD